MLQWFEGLTPELVWGLYTRGLGLVFLISYASLIPQILDCSGRTGGFPAWRLLDRIRRDFPPWRRWLHFPTVLWVNDSDLMLRAITWVGAAASLLVIYGGPLSPWALLVCYLCYLSLDPVVGFIYPWDCLLLEAGVMALFLPATHALPDLHALVAPAPALTWAHRLLLFRVMFGFGKQKFTGATRKDLSYLKGFLIGQPLLSPLAWYVQKLPVALLGGLMVFMFWAEVPAPFLGLFPGTASIICALTTIFLMIGVWATGNFGYFSLLTMVAAIPLFDNVTPRQLEIGSLFAPGAPVVTNAYVVIHTLCALLAFPFNSWVGQCWHIWAAWFRLPRLYQLPLDFLHFMHPFRWLHPYGVFPPNTGPGLKTSLLIEASWDDQTWHELEYKFALANNKSPPKFIAPYHPRGDQAVIYETFGLAPTGLLSGTMGPWDPYAFGTRPSAHVLAQRITDGSTDDFTLKGGGTPLTKNPPRAIRISTVIMEPVSLKHHFATGEWWKRTYIGPHMPPRQHDPTIWEDFLPEPELWHWDSIMWRRRSRLKKLIDGSLAGREDPMKLALAECDDLTSEDVDRFWNELVPLAAAKRESFDTLPDFVPEVRARYSRQQLRALHRLLARFSLLLVARWEPAYLGRGSKPLIPVDTYFHLWMLAQHIIGNGKDAYLQALADPMAAVNAELPRMTPQTGMYFFSLFRYEIMVFDAQKMRLLATMSAPYDEEQKRALLEADRESMSSFHRFSDRISRVFSGFYCIAPTIIVNFKGPRFDLGYAELYPTFRQLPTGEIAIRSYANTPGDPVPVTSHSQPAE
jgi:hypothetical protein